MRVTITDATALDNIRTAPRPCGHQGPYIGPQGQVLACNRPMFHQGPHAWSTRDYARLATWGPHGEMIRPAGTSTIHPPKARPRPGTRAR